jgi:hypothetical protein
MGSLPITILTAPSDERQEPGSVNVKAAQYPSTFDASSVDPAAVAQSVVSEINDALKKKDAKAVGDLFLEDSYWRDHLCLSWDFHTLKGGAAVTDFLQKQFTVQSISIDSSAPHRSPQVANVDAFGDVKCVTTFIKVTTEFGSGQGVLRLTTRNGAWKILTLYTTLKGIRGHEEPRGPRRWAGHTGGRNGMSWQETRDADRNFEGKDPAVLILGMPQPFLLSRFDS